MISKKYRLREYEVARVFKRGKPSFGAYWTMNFVEARNGKNHRMAVSVSRKHDKRAVQRNRYRRGLYDGMKDLMQNTKDKIQKTEGDALENRTTNNEKQITKNYLCVFTLKKGLKIAEKKIPQIFVDDAIKLFLKSCK